MYCMNCGVKLADTEVRCPLCGITAYHPQLHRQEARPLYPPRRAEQPQVNARAALIVVSMAMLLAFLITLLCDLRINDAVTWSGFVMGALILGYVTLVLPYWFRKRDARVFIPVTFVAVAGYLWYIAFAVGGGWFWSFALPVTAFFGVLATAMTWLLKLLGGKALVIFGGAFVVLGVAMPGLEYLIYATFHLPKFSFWSVYPMTALVLLGALLVFLFLNDQARETMERKFFI